MEKCIIEYIERFGDWYQLEQRVEFALSYSLTRNLPQDTLVKRLQSQMPHTKVMWVVSIRLGTPTCQDKVLQKQLNFQQALALGQYHQ